MAEKQQNQFTEAQVQERERRRVAQLRDLEVARQRDQEEARKQLATLRCAWSSHDGSRICEISGGSDRRMPADRATLSRDAADFSIRCRGCRRASAADQVALGARARAGKRRKS